MSSGKILVGLLIVSLSVFLFSGCGPEKQEGIQPEKSAVVQSEKNMAVEPEKAAPAEKGEQPVGEVEKVQKVAKPDAMPVAFKFSVGDVTRYKAMTEDEDSVQFNGKWPKEADYENKRNNTRIEISYTQRIESVDEAGNAVAKITIDAIRASYVYKNLPSYDFDNRRQTDKRKAMYKLLGKSYTVRIAPTGKFIEVIDASAAQAAVPGNSVEEQRAAALVTNEAIEQRHGFFTLPETDENRLGTGDTWDTIRSFSFRMLGTKTYERIYTITGIEDSDGHKIGVVDMKAIPSAEGAEALHQQGQTPDLSQMADNSEEYIGEMRFDLTSGKVQECVERLISRWTMLDTSAQDAEPAALVMMAIRVSRIDKLD